METAVKMLFNTLSNEMGPSEEHMNAALNTTRLAVSSCIRFLC